jgi:hypothetical protein
MTRKYRQRGYMESQRDEREHRKPPLRKKPLTPEEKAQLRGLRHATAREAREVVRCPKCGTNVQTLGAIGPETTCPQCNAALHCCRACLHFDSSARWECRGEISERIPDKLKANTCALYTPRLVLDATGKRVETRASNDPKARFESLFKR